MLEFNVVYNLPLLVSQSGTRHLVVVIREREEELRRCALICFFLCLYYCETVLDRCGLRSLLLLLLEPGLADIGTAELNVEHALHVAENLLVWGGVTALEGGNDCCGGVALGRKILLRQTL